MGIAREKLYEEVWAEPMTKVAARYSVSSSFLARVCKRLNVPRPERGYWAQLQVGKAPPKPDLPAVRPGDELEWTRDGEPRRVPRALPKPPDDVEQNGAARPAASCACSPRGNRCASALPRVEGAGGAVTLRGITIR